MLNVQNPVDSMGFRVDFLLSLWKGVLEQFKERLAGLKRGYFSEEAETSSLLQPKRTLVSILIYFISHFTKTVLIKKILRSLKGLFSWKDWVRV